MSTQGVPIVSGPNGQRDKACLLQAIECRYAIPASEEAIGGARFSLWKVEAPLPGAPPRFSPAFFALVVLGCLGLLVLGSWVAGRIRQGDFLTGQIFAVGLFVALYGGMFAVALVRRRQKPVPLAPDTPPNGIPLRAVACLAGIRRRGRSVGWLWFEGDHMRFRGAGFDFDLRRGDFRTEGPLLKVFRRNGLAGLLAPEGVSEYLLFLTPGQVAGSQFVRDRSRWSELEPDFEVWESGTSTDEPPLFPPIRPVPTLPARLGWPSFVVPPLFMGGILGFAALVLPIEPTNGEPPPSPGSLALAGSLFGLLWPLLLWSSDRTAQAYTREADRSVRTAAERL